ncbi:MAG: Asp23/Gls24 family envelope stress response protein [Lachnospiraceae bacterium]|nr:Asp23/Gls24 family envelope stress response protein [Lachnospiraceae bacterium]
MKGSSVDTHLGNIIIDSNVITQYAGSVAVECFGIVGMANVNVKDGLVKLLKINSADIGRGISVNVSEDHKLILDFHVIVSYGVSIKAVVDNLITNVKYKVEEFSGLEIEAVNVYVEDVKVIDD